MIRMVIEKKCEGCPYFDVEQEATDITTFGDKHRQYLHELKCEHHHLCEHLEEYLREVIANEAY